MKGRYHWSNAAYSARFWKLHASIAVPILGILLHPGWLTVGITVAYAGVLIWIEVVQKMTIVAYTRKLNIVFTGRVKATVNLVRDMKNQ